MTNEKVGYSREAMIKFLKIEYGLEEKKMMGY